MLRITVWRQPTIHGLAISTSWWNNYGIILVTLVNMSEQPNVDSENEPPPLYQGDKAWTKERETRASKIWDSLDKDGSNNVALKELRDLIVECQNAVRAHPDGNAHMDVIDDSKLLGLLLGTFFKAVRDKI